VRNKELKLEDPEHDEVSIQTVERNGKNKNVFFSPLGPTSMLIR
jgi:hypothetical protein